MTTKEYIDITAAVTREKGSDFVLEQAKIRAPKADEVLVKIVATGMCHTDMIVRDQDYPVPLPLVLGHEGAGIVERVGPLVKDIEVGDHVVLSYGYCSKCSSCHSGHEPYCKEFYPRNFGGSDMEGNNAIEDADGKPLNDHFFAQSSFATYALSLESNTIKSLKMRQLSYSVH